MDRRTLMLAGALLPAFAARPAPEKAGMLPAAEAAITAATTGCQVTVSATNGSATHRAAVSRESRVRTKVGLVWSGWETLDKSVWIDPGQSATWTYSLDLGCDVPRTYRFYVRQFDGRDQVTDEAWISFPQTDLATTSSTLALGSLFNR